MVARHTPLWTLEELAQHVQAALAADHVDQRNGQVTEIPSLRTIRFYTTTGLLDRAAEMRGRTAFYSRKHLLQLVAIKRLQAEGVQLAEVQERLAGLPESALRKLARVPDSLLDAASGTEPGEPRKRVRAEGAFWSEAPSEPARALPVAAPATPVGLMQSLSLNEAVMLLVSTASPLNVQDVEAIRNAAEPLLHVLHQRGLLPPNKENAS